MYHNFTFDNVSEALPPLLGQLMAGGDEVGSRAGRVRELTHVGITLQKPWRREVLVDGRKPSIAAQIAETMWVLSGRDDITWLEHYLPRARMFSDDGERWRAGYGKRLRSWPRREGNATTPIDQLRYVVDTLKDSALSRQAVATIWDPQVDTAPGKDIPCNNWLSFSSRLGKLDLMVAIRSNDIIWGWSGINAFEWSALQEIVAGILGVNVGGLHFATTSLHIYDQHWGKASQIIEYEDMSLRGTRPADSPRFDREACPDLETFDQLAARWFQLEYDIRTGSPLVDGYVERFPEPMLRSWLRVLQWWWSKGDRSYLKELDGTALELATQYSVQPKREEAPAIDLAVDHVIVTTEPDLPEPSKFLQFAISTHNEKHDAYGDSWKRRGEMLGIMANIARKIDRLGKGETSDETSADTAMDLMVYLAKYRTWLADHQIPAADYRPGVTQSDTTDAANKLLRLTEMRRTTDRMLTGPGARFAERWLTQTFDRLEDAVNRKDSLRYEIVDHMLLEAYCLAYTLWQTEQRRAHSHTQLAMIAGDDYRGADVD